MLNTHVLVLNKSWVAVNVATAKRALVLLYQGQARVVHPADYAIYDFEDWCDLSQLDIVTGNGNPRVIHTPSLKIVLPEIIILSMFNGFIRREVQFSRRNIFIRDKHQCQYCGKRFNKNELSLDHVIPRSRGGGETWDNLVSACLRCNVKKGNRTPEEANMHLIHKPKKPVWLPRFGAPLEKDEMHSWKRFLKTHR